MSLAGGDPDQMTLRSFMSAAYSLLVGEYQRLGIDLASAVEKVNESIHLKVAPAVTERTPTVVDNDRALADLQRMMGGA